LKALLIGGVTSGVGKTTIATGLMGVLARHNLKVQPFKTGPDYIDTSYHTWVTGNPSRNLDTWMLSHRAVVELFNRAMRGKDIGIIEGVMGLYDGHSATADTASSAELAKLLKVPVILVVDARNGARSLAAMVQGYQAFDSSLKLGGVILNGIGSESHFKICREAIEHYTGVKVVGYLPRQDILVLPERHLGLVPTVEGPASEEFRKALLAQCEATFDIPTILQLAGEAAPPATSPELFPTTPLPQRARIAVARDKAFSFYYQDSLDLLAGWGAELAEFSPLTDEKLPGGIGGLYIGGGFPEMYAEQIAANDRLKKEVKGAADSGMPVYAECGGLMYLGRSIVGFDGREHIMSSVLPLASRIDKPKLTLGYRTIRALNDGPFLEKGQTARGHEFHWSNLQSVTGIEPAYSVEEKGGASEGFQAGNILASYIHLHLGTVPGMAKHFVDRCASFRGNQNL
jgi:cobyrinic acid a,c-diamide synthase